MAIVGVTPAQVRTIHTLAGKAGLDKDGLHTLMSGICGKDSTKKLTISEAVRVIDRLRTLTGETPPAPSAPPPSRTPPVTGRLTGKQLGYIQRLEHDLGWASDPKRLRGYTLARFKVGDPRFLTPDQASQLIEALKAMHAGGRAERRAAMPESGK